DKAAESAARGERSEVKPRSVAVRRRGDREVRRRGSPESGRMDRAVALMFRPGLVRIPQPGAFPRVILQLRDRDGNLRKEGADLGARRGDCRDAQDRDETGEQRVLDQVLAPVVAHQRNHEVLHNQLFSTFSAIWLIAALPSPESAT